jgi:hypothetical protein
MYQVCAVSFLLSVAIRVAALHPPIRQSSNTSLGYIYALARNASTNEFQFIDVDLTTWETNVSPLPSDVPIAGEASAFLGGFFWSFTMDRTDTRSLIGIDVVSKAIAHSINASAWVPSVFMLNALFPVDDKGGLLAIGIPAPGQDQLLYYVSEPLGGGAGNTTHLGALPCDGCSDWAWDPVGERLYAVYGEDSDDGAPPSLVVFSVANLSAPVVTANVTLGVRGVSVGLEVTGVHACNHRRMCRTISSSHSGTL